MWKPVSNWKWRLLKPVTTTIHLPLRPQRGADVRYTVTDGNQQSVGLKDSVLTVAGGTADNSGNAELTFALADEIVKYSGTYTGNVTFTVSLTNAAGSGN